MNTNSTAPQNEAPRQVIETAVITSIAGVLRREPRQITLESRLEEDLGLDSMSLIHVNIGIEEQLRCALSIGDAPERHLSTIRDLVEFVEEILNTRVPEARS